MATGGRSQSLHSTDAVQAVRGVESKATRREGRQEGGCVTDRAKQIPVSRVPARARQGTATHDRDGSWVEASIWTERMLLALGNGVKGGQWFSLMDKAIRCFLRGSWAVRHAHGVALRETIPMRKPPTGEPYAGKPHVRFGGRGGATLPDPYHLLCPSVPTQESKWNPCVRRDDGAGLSASQG